MLNIGIFTLLRNDQSYIDRWIDSITPLVNNKNISVVYIATSNPENASIKKLSESVSVFCIPVPRKDTDPENPLEKLEYVRECWNTALPYVETDYVFAMDDDILPPINILDTFQAYNDDASILAGPYEMHKSNILMLSLTDFPSDEYSIDLIPEKFKVHYAARGCLFGKTSLFKSVALPLVELTNKYLCTGFCIAKNCKDKNIPIYAIRSAHCKHLD